MKSVITITRKDIKEAWGPWAPKLFKSSILYLLKIFNKYTNSPANFSYFLYHLIKLVNFLYLFLLWPPQS